MERPVVKTNADRNREYRLRKGEEINAKRRISRMADRAIITPKIEYEEKTIKKVAKLPPAKTEAKQENTKGSYISFIRQFYKRYTGDELNEDNDIIKKINEERYNAMKVSKQFKKIIEDNFDKIKGIAYEVNGLYKILRGIRGFTDIEKRLYAYVLEYKNQYEEKRSVVVVEDKENMEISFDTEEISKNIDKIEDKTDKIIYGYIFIIHSRLNDLRITKITNNKEETKDEEYNWIYEDKLYINKTKTGNKQVIDIPSEFSDLYKDKTQGYILGSLIAPSTLSQRLQVITKGVYGKVYTYLNIRHLYATYINKKGSSYKEREQTAKQSGHSVVQQMKYAY